MILLEHLFFEHDQLDMIIIIIYASCIFSTNVPCFAVHFTSPVSSHILEFHLICILEHVRIRAKVQTFGGGFGGPQEVTSGGNALKFYASVRLNIRRIGLVKKGEEVTY